MGAALSFASVPGTESAIANGDTRTLNLVNAHTHESIAATYMVGGQYDRATLEKLNWFLRDYRQSQSIAMDPHLFDVVWESYRQSGSREPIVVLSGYRSPQTNAMLRRRSKAVAKFSQHMLGKAMDQHYVDVPMAKIREIAMKLQRGGVGYYPTSGTPFVHMDAGNVRSWPRMSYEHLARLFPDGKTVHIPANGVPMRGYEEARAEIIATGRAYAPVSSVGKSRSFFARLFGGGDDAGDAAEASGAQVASNSGTGLNEDSRTFFMNQGRVSAPAQAQPLPARHESVQLAKRAAPVVSVPQPHRDLIAAALAKADSATPPQSAAIALAMPAASAFPMPPHRPTALLALLTRSDIPLPPVRPQMVASLDASFVPKPAAASLDPRWSRVAAATRAGKPTVLPDLITQGNEDKTLRDKKPELSKSPQTLAYAEATDTIPPTRQQHVATRPAALLRGSLPQTRQVRAVQAHVVRSAAISESAAYRGLTSKEAAHNFRSHSVAGAIAPALRRSVAAQTVSLLGAPLPGFTTHFGPTLASIPTDHFSQ